MIASFARLGLFSLFLIFFSLTQAQAASEDIDSAKANLPKELEMALTGLLEAAPIGSKAPSENDVNMVLRFATATAQGTELYPASRDLGSGIFHHEVIRQPLRTLVTYLLDPSVPGEAIYPSSVRRNAWLPGSEALQEQGALMIKSSYPPAKPLLARGVEFEETTPELTSGCFYSYTLDRLFILTSMAGRTALIVVSRMPKTSGIGLKGHIAGNDSDWAYVYTQVKGTNLPMLSWAETYLYESATVSAFIEPAAGSKTTDVYVFKWAKAGWSGMNVVKPSHILAGVKRYLSSFKLIMESPNRPEAKAIAAWAEELGALSEKEIKSKVAGLAQELERRAAGDDILAQAEFQKVLQGGRFAETLNKENALAEALKLRMRESIGLSTPKADKTRAAGEPDTTAKPDKADKPDKTDKGDVS